MSRWLQSDTDVFLLRNSRHSKPLKSKRLHNLDDPAHRAWRGGDGEYVFAAARALVECLCRQGSSAICSADRQSRSGLCEGIWDRPRTPPTRGGALRSTSWHL